MTDLRAVLIEAGASDLVGGLGGESLTLRPSDVTASRRIATHMLDTILDTLADRADEWDCLATDTFDDYPDLRAKSFTYNLIAVLRATEGESARD